MKTIILLDVNYPDTSIEQSLLMSDSYQFVALDKVETEQEIEVWRRADAILVREALITEDMINCLERCKVIVRYGVGTDNIDKASASKKELFVANVPDYGTEEVSDHALALLLSVSRRIVTRTRDVRKGKWNIGASEKIYSFREKTIGIIGFGRIGQAFLKKALPLGFTNVLIYDPWTHEEHAGVQKVDLDTLCRNADVISLHTPLTSETHHLINREVLDIMKPNAILINSSRGGLIDENALFHAINEEKIFGAGLDVLEKEPPQLDNPLLSLDQVIITDHMGWYSENSITNLRVKAAEEVRNVLEGGLPKNWLNPWEVKV